MIHLLKKFIVLSLLSVLLAGTAIAQRMMTGGDGIGKMSYFTCPSMGEMRFPVIIVKYSDVGLSESDENVIRHFDDFFNKEGYNWNGATGSIRDYFLCASAGKFSPRFDILGVVQLKNNRKYYGNGTGTAAGHPDEMVIEGVKAFEGKVDFSVYDSNGDKYVDNVIVVYAGNSERLGASTVAVLPTSYLVSFSKYGVKGYEYGYEQDGLYFDSYTVTSEMAYNRYDAVGIFLHEFSHALGLTDEYNLYDSKADYTPMEYDLMDIGLYNNERRTPPTYSAFERYALGWIDLEVIEESCNIELEPLDVSNKGYIIPVTENEFFILENRRKHGWDAYLPGSGLFVWHIDYDLNAWYNNQANYEKDHQRIRLIRPGGTQLTLTPWSGLDLGLSITDIAEHDGKITAAVIASTGIDQPKLHKPEVRVSGRTITSDTSVRVLELSGRTIGQGKRTTVPSAGIYILKTPSSTTKVAVSGER